jgi:hypothetical protein
MTSTAAPTITRIPLSSIDVEWTAVDGEDGPAAPDLTAQAETRADGSVVLRLWNLHCLCAGDAEALAAFCAGQTFARVHVTECTLSPAFASALADVAAGAVYLTDVRCGSGGSGADADAEGGCEPLLMLASARAKWGELHMTGCLTVCDASATALGTFVRACAGGLSSLSVVVTSNECNVPRTRRWVAAVRDVFVLSGGRNVMVFCVVRHGQIAAVWNDGGGGGGGGVTTG